MSGSLGDFDTSTVVYGKFTTYRPSTGAPHTLAGTPALSVYKDNSTTQSTTGVTLTTDFDSVTGFNHFAIDTSADGTFYSAGSFFDIVITTGTVDSVSAVGTVVGRFTLRKTSALKPTTAARTLDVSEGGEAGIDWANVGSPTTVVGLSGTTVKTATDVETDTADIQSRLPAALVSGRIDASVGAMEANTITAAATAADFATEVTAGLAQEATLTTIASYIDTEVAAIKAKTDNLPTSPAAVGSAMTLTSAYDFAKGTVAIAEDYAADGTAATPAQLLYMLWSLMAEKNISSTTLTAKKLDGSTTAMTFTLNDATSPTSITRAT